MQALVSEDLRLIVSLPLKKIYPLLLPSHNCIIIHNVQFSRYKLNSLRNSMKFLLTKELQSISYGGEYRDRTGDLLLARQALSQLS